MRPAFVWRRWSCGRWGGGVVALNIPAGQLHTARALERGTVILEMKDGAYETIGEEDLLKV